MLEITKIIPDAQFGNTTVKFTVENAEEYKKQLTEFAKVYKDTVDINKGLNKIGQFISK